MAESLEYLYHQKMIALTQSPIFKHDYPLNNMVTVRNPMCGDIISIGQNDNKQFCWHGEGCLICLASAEALCQTLGEAHDPQIVCDQIDHFFNHDTDYTLPEFFLPLSSVKKTQSRIKCVMLAVSAVRKFLTHQQGSK